ncbi:alpha/beta hydrolase [Citrobacter sp. Cb220]|uniref:RBBP9/YdeN family alpha/beta hydrolase n=1 Tax=Citrobacter sp. Cb220 TaxID=2985034 RepID=UPI002574D69C|nr:alpha/beta hydrolase [Citrobacter sp. Cb220]MDM3315957.1 alpha/beta hydrolase [Citrobacter sp. Cb220]
MTISNPQQIKNNSTIHKAALKIGSSANTWLIAHSPGCVTILLLLERLPEDEMPHSIILVSGFTESLPLWRQYGLTRMEEFTFPPVEMERIKKMIKHRYVIASLNDMIVPTEMSLRPSQQLNAPFYARPDSGHFLGDDGVTELPLVLELLKKSLQK